MCFYAIGVHQPRKRLLATVTWKCWSSRPGAHSCELQRIKKKNLDHVKDSRRKKRVKGHVWERDLWFAIPFIIIHLSYRLGSHPSKWNMLMRETEMRGSKGYRRKEWLVKWKEENGRGSRRKGERGRERKGSFMAAKWRKGLRARQYSPADQCCMLEAAAAAAAALNAETQPAVN